MNASIVVDPMFGDGGKGITTDRLCTLLKKPIVVRYNGGQNAGHTVTLNKGLRHVFTSFGSGTLRGAPTYWSKYCTFHPNAFIAEYNVLTKKGFTPTLFMDNLAMVTTPYDLLYNQALEKSRNPTNAHGSMGVGFGTTIERNTTPYKFYAQDVLNPVILEKKLSAVFNYYQNKVDTSGNAELKAYWDEWDFNSAKTKFISAVEKIKAIDTVQFVSEAAFWGNTGAIRKYGNIVFEGSQGIMLDMDFGFFPNVTRSNCTSKNALELFYKYFPDVPVSDNDVQIYYVTRAYQTRHGNGYMTNEDKSLNVRKNRFETNVSGDWQGDFRRTRLDFDLLNYAMTADSNYSGAFHTTRNLVVICLDQVDGNIQATSKGQDVEISPDKMQDFLPYLDVKFNKLLLSTSDCSDTMQSFKVSNYGFRDGEIISLTEEVSYRELVAVN